MASILRSSIFSSVLRAEGVRAFSASAHAFKMAAADAPKKSSKAKAPDALAKAKAASKNAQLSEKEQAKKLKEAARAEKVRLAEEAKAAKAAEKAAKSAEKAAKKLEKAQVAALPKLPKAAASAYMVWFKEFFNANREEFTQLVEGKIHLSKISQLASAKWQSMSDADRQPYEEQSRKNQVAYRAEYTKFYESLDPKTRHALEKKIKRKLKAPSGFKAAKIEMRDRPGNPGKPGSAFFEFLSSIREELMNDPALAPAKDDQSPLKIHMEVARLGGERWRALSASEKEEWQTKTTEKKRIYDEWVKTQ